jgi:hypothetical protein
MKTFRRLLMVSLITVLSVSAGVDSVEGAVLRRMVSSRNNSSGPCKPSGGLLQSRPVSPASTWSHRHPKWNAGRKATGAAYLK